jgi:hypothetical protein
MASFIPNKTVMLTKDQEHLWSDSIGGLILNFGHVEFCSFRWIRHFATDPLLGDLVIDMTLDKRLQVIRELIERSHLSPDARKRAIELWREVGEISKIRNTIAHNPIIFGVGPDKQPAMGIPNVKHMKGSGPRTVTLLHVSKIIKAAHRLVAISDELDKIIVAKHEPTHH